MRVNFLGVTPWPRKRYNALVRAMCRFSYDTAFGSVSYINFYTILLWFFFLPPLTLVIVVLSPPPKKIYRGIKSCCCVDHHHHHHHPAVCLTTGSKPLPKRSLHILRSRSSSFKWEHPLLSWRSSSSFLRLLPCLLVTSIAPFIFPSITCFRRQFIRKMWPIQLAFRFPIACRIFLCSLTWSNTSSFSH